METLMLKYWGRTVDDVRTAVLVTSNYSDFPQV